MPRRERTVARGALVAAAKSYYPKNKRGDDLGNKQPGEWWQHQGWEFYDSITEFGQAAVIQGALLSRAKLIIEERGDDGVWRQTKNPAVASFLDELYGGEEGHSEMLRLLGIHLTVSGEAWIISPEISKIGTSTAPAIERKWSSALSSVM